MEILIFSTIQISFIYDTQCGILLSSMGLVLRNVLKKQLEVKSLVNNREANSYGHFFARRLSVLHSSSVQKLNKSLELFWGKTKQKKLNQHPKIFHFSIFLKTKSDTVSFLTRFYSVVELSQCHSGSVPPGKI